MNLLTKLYQKPHVMKVLKVILIVCLIFAFSCSSDDDNDDTTPKEFDVNGTIDISALNLLVGTDATALVTFDGVSSATYTTDVIPGDKVNYSISNSSANTEVRIIDFRFNIVGSNTSSIDWDDSFNPVKDTISVPAKAYIDVNTNAFYEEGADEYKFDIDFKVYVNGISNHIVYSTDPKLKIRDRR